MLKCIHICTHAHALKCSYIMCTHMYAYTYTQLHAYTHSYTQVHSYKYTHACAHMLTRMPAYYDTHIHTRAHIHAIP